MPPPNNFFLNLAWTATVTPTLFVLFKILTKIILHALIWHCFSATLVNLCLIAETCGFEVPPAGQICMIGAGGSDYSHNKKNNLHHCIEVNKFYFHNKLLMMHDIMYVRLTSPKRWSEAWPRLRCFYHHWPRQMRLVGNNRTDSGVSACWALRKAPEEAAHRGVSVPADMRSLTTGQGPPKGAKACNQSCAER